MAVKTIETVGRLVAKDYRTASIFKKYKIDFCCGGGKSIEDACRLSGADYEDVISDLAELESRKEKKRKDFVSWTLSRLVDHIISVHHGYLRENTPIIGQFVNQVKLVHGKNKPNVSEIADHFNSLSQELNMHMQKEEGILFPYIKSLEESKQSGEIIASPFGTIENPIQMMISEHENAGNELEIIRNLTENYLPPRGACATHKVSYGHLKDYESNLMEHIHLENNILFPRAIQLEQELLKDLS